MSIVLDKLDEEKFNINIIAWLELDKTIQSCYTNFRDIVADTIVAVSYTHLTLPTILRV